MNAETRAADIRSRLDSLVENLEVIPGLVAQAYAEGDWEALGYDTWEAYVLGEYKTGLLKLAKHVRKEWVMALNAVGMSQREIAPVVNVSHPTVGDDLRGQNLPGRSTDTDAGTCPVIGIGNTLRRLRQDIRYVAGEYESPDDRLALADALEKLAQEIRRQARK